MARKIKAVVQKGQYLGEPPEYRVIYVGISGKVEASKFFKNRVEAQKLAKKINTKK